MILFHRRLANRRNLQIFSLSKRGIHRVEHCWILKTETVLENLAFYNWTFYIVGWVWCRFRIRRMLLKFSVNFSKSISYQKSLCFQFDCHKVNFRCEIKKKSQLAGKNFETVATKIRRTINQSEWRGETFAQMENFDTMVGGE
jgi:hypothetical protein